MPKVKKTNRNVVIMSESGVQTITEELLPDLPKTLEPGADPNIIYEIPLDLIRPAPWNPPRRMDPKVVEDLADSIALHGQQIPALLRPVEGDITTGDIRHPSMRYELVFGHRRFAAQKILSARNAFQPGVIKLKAFIRNMSEQDAMILSGIENLQRQGFTDIEEAEFFRTAGERYGESAVKMLAEKLSVSERYIRKRVEILKLPDTALDMWRSGQWHVGHMEQLLRVGEPEKVDEFLSEMKSRNGLRTELEVWQLKDWINRLEIPLHSGRFEKSDCKTCRRNTECQLRLFGGEKNKSQCLDQKCFTAKQQAWLDLNWSTCDLNKFGTQAAMIGGWETKTTGSFKAPGDRCGSDPPATKKCKSCSRFVTVLNLKLNPIYSHQRVCMGAQSCYDSVKSEVKKQDSAATSGKESAKADPDAPRVAWHGEYYRQEFYRQEIQRLISQLLTEDPRRIQLALATIIKSRSGIHEWFCSKLGVEPPKKESWQVTVYLPFHLILKLARSLNALQAEYLMAEALAQLALDAGGYQVSFSDQDRQALAEFLDIDFACFQVSDDWLQKKTKSELVRFIVHESGLAKEARFQDAMEAREIPTLEKLAACKKPVLVDLITNCGVDLHGRLPKEIADRPKLGEIKGPVEQSDCSAILEPPHCYVCGCSADKPCEGGCTLTAAHGIGDEDLEGEYICSQCAETIRKEREEEEKI